MAVDLCDFWQRLLLQYSVLFDKAELPTRPSAQFAVRHLAVEIALNANPLPICFP